MSNIKFNQNELNDFSLSPVGSQSGDAYYQAFLECKKLVNNLPQELIGKNPEFEFQQILKEVIARKNGSSVLYRRNLTANDLLCLLWFSRVKSISKLFVANNKTPSFKGITPGEMAELSKLSANEANLSKLASILFEYGIVLIFERAIPGMKLDGAVYLSESGHPVIAMSLRYARLDYFWFTLMHELAHISIHLESLTTPILEDLDDESDILIEKQANQLALNSFINRSDWRNCPPKYERSNKSVLDFANQMGIHPSIVAGRLQKELNRFDLFAGIINSLNVREVLIPNE